MNFKLFLESAEPIFPFGKHKGKKISDIPDSYLQWALDNATALKEPLRGQIAAHLKTTSPAKVKDENKGWLAKVITPIEPNVTFGDQTIFKPGTVVMVMKYMNGFMLKELNRNAGTTSDRGFSNTYTAEELKGKLDWIKDGGQTVTFNSHMPPYHDLYDKYVKPKFDEQKVGHIATEMASKLKDEITTFAAKRGLHIDNVEQEAFKGMKNWWYKEDGQSDAYRNFVIGYYNAYSDNSWTGYSVKDKMQSGIQFVMKRLDDWATRDERAEALRKKEELRDKKWAAQGMVRCSRCGGAGGAKHWPGFTCFDCGGVGAVPEKDD